ncbi:TRAP-type transport system periplasmic substrate-binding protein [Haloferax gibbonsii]|jgi:TRAP transporter TAXI family solute receptor|uniref:TRAP-type transport system periplasmic substrate-binding protein n=3 Tax=Haloferax TaxID=2251 RepID=A0A871BJ42_HALGI|nr:TAXI family TRAP transporter solute-binding subunit [Haloferax sp. ATB1]QOS12785.1 TRAP-type transport system periplasmic substrate-binding protein [Haloferax gibbonsii]
MSKQAHSARTRRSIIKAAAAGAGTVAITGCLGGDSESDSGSGSGSGGDSGSDGGSSDDSGSDGGSGGSSYQLRMGGSSQGSTAFNSMQALARALNEHSDSLRMTVEQTQGNVANMYQYDQGNIPAVATDNNTINKAVNETDRFNDEPVDNIGYQSFRFNGLDIFWVAVEGSGIESTADFAGKTVYPIQPGFGTRLLTEEVMRVAGMWEEVDIINVNTSDIPGAIEEGRVDAVAVYGSNRVELTGWAKQIDARNDVYLVDVADNFKQAIEEVGGARLAEIEPYGWNQEVTKVTDSIVSWNLDLQCLLSPEVPADAAHELARISHEHGETIREADQTYADHSDPADMATAVIPEHPVHPGVAEFYKEQDVWDDSWTVGDEA